MKFASYEQKNKSTRRGTRFVPIGKRLSVENNRSPKITNMLSIKNSSMLRISVSENSLVE